MNANDRGDFANGLIIDMNPKTPEQLASLRQLTLVVYVLYALAWMNGITGVIALLINYIKREDARGTLYESHFTWQIRTFWWGLVWCVVGGSTFWFGIGFIVLAVAGLWYLYRLVKGFLNWSDNKPMEV